MEKTYARVAGLNVCFSGFDMTADCFSPWQNFITDSNSRDCNSNDIVFLHREDTYNENGIDNKNNIYHLYPLSFVRYPGKTVVSVNKTYEDNNIQMVANEDWSRLGFYNYDADNCSETIRLLTDAAFRSRLTYFAGCAVHASVIVHNGEAAIFVARSGTGKSTHAELWREHLSAEILNGDHAIVRLEDDRLYVYGSPWSGTSPYKKKRVGTSAGYRFTGTGESE